MYRNFAAPDCVSVVATSPPASEPIALADAKAALRIDHSDEDALLGAFIASSRAMVETRTRLRLMPQRVRLTYDRFPSVIRPPVAPVRSVVSITYDDADGVEQTLDPNAYVSITDRTPAEILPAYGGVWPAPRLFKAAVRVELEVGFADAAAIPADILAALRLMIGDQDRFRQNTLPGSHGELPMGVNALLAPHVLHV